MGSLLTHLLLLFSAGKIAVALPQPPASKIITEPPHNLDWQAYERGQLGPYPQITFHTSDASSPLVHVDAWSSSCDTDSYTFLTPHGEHISGNKAILLDHNGNLTWFHEERGAVYNFQVQQYKGNDYLTMWVGDDEYFGHGHGYYKMLDQTYTLAYTISAGNDVDGDYHDFSITEDDTALVTSYVKIPWDLSQHDRESGYIWDCRFQEIDVETNQVLFEWRASDHYTFTDMAVDSWAPWTGTSEDPWDWIHLNGVEKDDRGNFMICARYTNAVSYIDGKSGEFIWHLGGRNNSFVDMAEGNATRFTDPHMARWTNSKNHTLSLFDNVAFWNKDGPRPQSHGLHLQLDPKKAIAKMVTDLVHPSRVFAESEGSVHQLGNGNFFVGYGSAARYSEFSSNGTLLCNTHYSPLYEEGDEAKPGYVQSYRVYKQKWEGHPKEAPDMKIERNTFHVSWNGATEVTAWKLAARGAFGKAANSWTSIGTFAKTGFETSIGLSGAAASSYLITALDQDQAPIRAWNVHPEGDVWELFLDDQDNTHHSPPSAGLIVIVGCVAFVLYLNRRYLPAPRRA